MKESFGIDAKDLGGRQALTKTDPNAALQDLQNRYAPVTLAADFQGEGEGLAVILRRYLYMVLKRRWLILGVTLAFFVLGGVRTLLQTPLYVATVRLQIEREAAKIVDGNASSINEMGGVEFLKTQFELLKSSSMAERVVSLLRLHEDDGFLKPQDASLLGILSSAFSASGKQLPAPSAREKWVATIVRSNVSVLPVAGSRLVDVSYIDPSPARAQQIANGYAEAYVASNLDKRFEANSYAKMFLEDQVKQLKIRLEESEQAIVNFAESQKMVEVGDKASIAENNLAAANTAVGQLISERMKNEQSWRQVENVTVVNLPQFLSNNVIETLRAQRKALETDYQEKLENYKPSYPAMMQISNKMKEVDRQLAAEVKTIKNSLKGAYESSLAQENEMKERVEALRQEVLDLQKKSIQYNILKREAETNRGLYNNLLQRLKEVDIAGGVGTNNIFIVDHAALPGSPSEPNLSRALLLSLSLGLGAGVGLAFFLERLDDRVRAPEEVEELTGLPAIGVIPRLADGEIAHELITDPKSGLSEAYRTLATGLQFSTGSGLPRSLVVTSAGPGEGKSTTAIAIARHFAQMGLKVLIVDSDLRKPSLHGKLQLSNEMGLSNYLSGASLPPEVIQRTDQPNLMFMASGPLPPNPAELLSGTRIFSLISLGSEAFDLILFDSPPLLGIADAQLLAGATAATIFVVGAGQQRRGVISAALRRLQMSRVIVLGAVLTKFDPKSVGFNYGYGYGYGYHYTSGAYSYSYGRSDQLSDQKRLDARSFDRDAA